MAASYQIAIDEDSMEVDQQPIDNQIPVGGQGLTDESPFDIGLELLKIIGQDSIPVDLPADFHQVIKVLRPLKDDIKLMAVRLRRPAPDKCEPRLWNSLAKFLFYMHNLEEISPEMKTIEKFGAVLDLVIQPSHKFPAEYARVAKYINDELEALNWGAVPVQPAEIEPEVEYSTGSAAISSKKKSSGQRAQIHFPRDDDPIYGLNGIMHHILRIQGPKVIYYAINTNFTRKNFRVFGHNGLTVGDCWPLQIALIRDGAHGMKMSGISGTMEEGAYSIVISGVYDDLDKDEGSVVYYSGSNSHDNTSSVPVTSNGTKVLQRSIVTRRPVRVFRSSEGTWRFCPSAGIRYDGLYTVTAVNIEKNRRHGAYKRFTLHRRGDQPDIQVNAPSFDLKKRFARVKNGYSRAPLVSLPTQ